MANPYLPNTKNWETFTLEPNVKDEVIVKVDSGGTPNTKEESYWGGDIPWITPKEFSNNEALYYQHTERYITKEGLANSSAKIIPAYSVLLTKRAPVGLVGINTVDMATNQGFLNFTCGSKLLPAYFANWLKLNKPYLQAISNGSTYDELYKSDLFEFQIAIPPVDYQKKVLAILSSIDLLIKLKEPIETIMTSQNNLEWIANQNERLNKIKDILIYQLFSGEIDANNLL
jgi:type I restriction enzyme S subunit